MPESAPSTLAGELFKQLKRRRFPIGPPDLDALRVALGAGFGWSSRDALRDLVVALWAKSTREADIVRALFNRLPWPDEWAPEVRVAPGSVPSTRHGKSKGHASMADQPVSKQPPAPIRTMPVARQPGNMPPLTLEGVSAADTRIALVEQYPLTHREIAQAFRRLRRPMRFGPATELDLDATVRDRLRSGMGTPPALRPRRRNTSQLSLWVDVEGSMAPYALFVEAFCQAIREGGLLHQISLHYFHDVPSEGSDRSLLGDLAETAFFPKLDPVLAQIQPLDSGDVFVDAQLERGVSLRAVLGGVAPVTAALIVSDAGAARGRVDPGRVLDSLAFVKALRLRASSVVWLNPVPRPFWANTVAAHLARHVPMFSLDRLGIQLAVNTLRGQPLNLERPL